MVAVVRCVSAQKQCMQGDDAEGEVAADRAWLEGNSKPACTSDQRALRKSVVAAHWPHLLEAMHAKCDRPYFSCLAVLCLA